MHVGVDQVRRHATALCVEKLERGKIGPERVAEADPDAPVVAGRGRTDHVSRLGCARGVAEVDPLRDERPLQHVHVVVPEARHQPGAVGVERLSDGAHGAGGCDVDDAALREEHIDRPVVGKHLAAGTAHASTPDGADARADHGRFLA